MAALPLVGCTRSPASAGSGQGLVPLGGDVFVPPHLRPDAGHDHGGPDGGGSRSAASIEESHGRVRPGYHEFGQVAFGEVATHTFQLRNTDPVPVTIQAVDPSCGCTIPRVSYRDPETGETVAGVTARTGDILTVPPGAVAELEVRIDTRGIKVKNTDKLISVRVTSDSVNGAFLTLETHLVVDLPFHTLPERLHLGSLPVSVGGAGRVELVPTGPAGARLTGIESTPPGVLADLIHEPHGTLDRWYLDVGIEPPVAIGEVVHSILLTTELPDGTTGAPFEVLVAARGAEDLEVRPARLHLRGEPLVAEAELTSLVPGAALEFVSARIQGDTRGKLVFEAVPVEPDAEGRSAKWSLSLTLATEGDAEVDEQTLSGSVAVTWNDGSSTPLVKEIPYVGFLR